METAGKITFRQLQPTDLPLLHRWLNTPHVSQWWTIDGRPNPSLEAVTAKYSPRILKKEAVDCYFFQCDGCDIGMIQAYDLDDFPAEKLTFEVEGKCIGLDLCIGEAAYVHRGLGSQIIRSFLRDIVFASPQVEYAVIDPQKENKIAIRAYEKAGFKYLRTVWYEPDKKYENIMAISKSEI